MESTRDSMDIQFLHVAAHNKEAAMLKFETPLGGSIILPGNREISRDPKTDRSNGGIGVEIRFVISMKAQGLMITNVHIQLRSIEIYTLQAAESSESILNKTF